MKLVVCSRLELLLSLSPLLSVFHARSNSISSVDVIASLPMAGRKSNSRSRNLADRFTCCRVDLCTGNGHLCSNQVQDDLPPVRTRPVFEHVDTPPGSQRESAVHKRYQELPVTEFPSVESMLA